MSTAEHEAWQEARKAHQKAQRALVSLKQKVREAESQLLNLYDLERSTWVAYKNAEWEQNRDRQIAKELGPARRGRRRKEETE